MVKGMVTIKYKRAYLPHKNVWYSINAEGHAGYAEAGKDIVCSAVSVMLYTLTNFLEYIGADELDAHDEEDFHVECKAFYHDEAVHTAFRMTVFGLQLLADCYPDNVEVIEEPDD